MAELSPTAERVIETISSQLELPAERVTLDAQFQEDLKADSLAVAQLILAFEETFGISVPDDEAEKIGSVSDAVTFIEGQLAKAG
ncbi:MAG: acyl carrier protein [Deltaproteobacteria bacterium]|nr:MAG: acyl carrier protein [Pseudomonadota bacterium]PIE66327.1 MAG: acyl carrier protein [Deltaproteobacteria bacterium]